MADYLFAAWDGGGAVPPTLDLAQAMLRRGHSVRVLADPTLREEVEAIGAEFRPWTTAPHRAAAERDQEVVRDWEARTPLGVFKRVRDRFICGPAKAFADDVLAEHARRPADVIVAEMFLRGVLLAAEAAGVPRASFLTTVNCLPTPGLPPFGAGFSPASNRAERLRDRAVASASRRLWNSGLDALNAARASVGLAPVTDVLSDMAADDPLLVLSPRALEFAQARPAANVHHVGPRLLDPAWAEAWSPPAGDAPLVLVGLSSTYMRQEALLARAAEAMGALDVRGVVTTGPEVDPATVGAPAGVQVLRSAPHGAVLPHARAVVTHGGHGTVVKALAHGVPLVVLPLGRDQNDVAARVVACGAGVRLKPSSSPRAIAAAVRRVLEDPRFAQAAARLASAIADDLARDRAVDVLESLVSPGAGRPSGVPLNARAPRRPPSAIPSVTSSRTERLA